MARNFNSEEHRAGLTLVVKPADDPDRPVDAERFLETATKWLASLASFASDSGHNVRWEIAELKRSSALLEVVPVDVSTGLVAASIAISWSEAVREIERSGSAPAHFRPATIRDIEQFASVASDLTTTVRAGEDSAAWPISVMTQKRLKDAVAALPSDEYVLEGTIRGRLAVLNSWNPKERWFRLRLSTCAR